MINQFDSSIFAVPAISSFNAVLSVPESARNEIFTSNSDEGVLAFALVRDASGGEEGGNGVYHDLEVITRFFRNGPEVERERNAKEYEGTIQRFKKVVGEALFVWVGEKNEMFFVCERGGILVEGLDTSIYDSVYLKCGDLSWLYYEMKTILFRDHPRFKV